MQTYTFKEDAVLAIKNAGKADPQKIGEALDKIRADHDGRLRPRDAWRAVEGKTRHTLYKHLEWNNEKCGEHWRDEQMRTIIRAIRVVDAEDEEKPAFLSVNSKDGTAYHHIDDVLSSEQLSLSVLKAASRDLEAWSARYSSLRYIIEMVKPARRALHKALEERPQA